MHFLHEIVWIPIKISLKFFPKCPINNIPALVQIRAWRRPGAKPLSEAMMINIEYSSAQENFFNIMKIVDILSRVLIKSWK